MKVRNMRWGYDGGGVACGPVEGNTIVEICVTGDDHHNYFVLVSRMMSFERVFVSEMPLFDLLIHMNHYDVDMEDEMEKVEESSFEDYDYEIGDEPEELATSEYAKVIHLARLAMQTYYGCDDEKTDAQTAKEFIAPYMDCVLEEMELPELEESEDLIEDVFSDEE